MDLNQLYFDHQIALMRAASGPQGARLGFRATARALNRRIFRVHRAAGAPAASHWGPAGWDRALCLGAEAVAS